MFLYELIKFNKNELYRRANGSTFLEISEKKSERFLWLSHLSRAKAIADCLTLGIKESKSFRH